MIFRKFHTLLQIFTVAVGQGFIQTPWVWGEIANIGVQMMGVWGLCPQRGPGAEPLVRGSGGEAPRSWKLFAV